MFGQMHVGRRCAPPGCSCCTRVVVRHAGAGCCCSSGGVAPAGKAEKAAGAGWHTRSRSNCSSPPEPDPDCTQAVRRLGVRGRCPGGFWFLGRGGLPLVGQVGFCRACPTTPAAADLRRRLPSVDVYALCHCHHWPTFATVWPWSLKISPRLHSSFVPNAPQCIKRMEYLYLVGLDGLWHARAARWSRRATQRAIVFNNETGRRRLEDPKKCPLHWTLVLFLQNVL